MVKVGFTLRQIQLFVLAAKTKNLTRVAEQVYLTVPAVSKQIKALERHYEVDLFEKHGNRLRLTTQGEHLLPSAQDILAQAKLAEYQFSSVKSVPEKPLHLFIGDTYQRLVFQALKVYNTKYGVPDYIIDGSDWSSLNRVMVEEIDTEYYKDALFIVSEPVHDDALIQSYALNQMKYVLLVGVDHPLASQGHVNRQTLCHQQWIASKSASYASTTIRRFIQRLNLHHKPIMLDSFESIRQAVLAGLGVAMLPRRLSCQDIENGRMVVLDNSVAPDIYNQLYVLHHRGLVLTQQQIHLIQFFQEYFAQ